MPEDEKKWGDYRREYNKENYVRVYLYLTPDEKRRWQEAAESHGLRLSAFVKQCVDEHLAV